MFEFLGMTQTEVLAMGVVFCSAGIISGAITNYFLSRRLDNVSHAADVALRAFKSINAELQDLTSAHDVLVNRVDMQGVALSAVTQDQATAFNAAQMKAAQTLPTPEALQQAVYGALPANEDGA